MKLELPPGMNPEHFAATYAFQNLSEAAVFEYGGTAFDIEGFERLLSKLEADSDTRLLWYAIEGQRVELRPVDWDQDKAIIEGTEQ